MIDHKNLLRFLTKQGVGISVEEFLFLLCVRLHTEDVAGDFEETKSYIQKYYSQNTFYGPSDNSTAGVSWSALIDKLVAQGFLTDFRKDKTLVSFTQLRVTELFMNKIWTNDKEAKWELLQNIIYDKCGTGMQLPNGKTLGYFFINQGDPVINTPEKLKDYFWVNICNNGSQFEIERFFHDLETYLEQNELQMKVSNFLINYHSGTLRKEIEQSREDKNKKGSMFKRR